MSEIDFVSLPFDGVTLCGIHHRVQNPKAVVIVVVGGPQNRVGSHRQYITLARHLQANDIACLRMDYAGMGDSTGTFAGFENLREQNLAFVDLARSIYPDSPCLAFYALCDAASSIALELPRLTAVTHAILLNPWVQEAGEEDTKPKAYYRERLLAGSFWIKLVKGEVNIIASLKQYLLSSMRPKQTQQASYVQTMGEHLDQWQGGLRLQLSSDDMVAQEFERKLRPRIQGFDDKVCYIEGDHTFSSKTALTASIEDCLEFLLTNHVTERD